jgi:hypothetical protein
MFFNAKVVSPPAQPSPSFIRNSIVWKTAASGKSIEWFQEGSLTIEESDVKDLTSLATQITKLDSITNNPLFIDADGADNLLGTSDDNFRPQSTSPCKDNGDQALILADFGDLDVDGNRGEATPRDLDLVAVPGNPQATTRVVGVEVDMGAYEVEGCTSDPNCNDTNICNGVEYCTSAHCTKSITDCNMNGIADFCDFLNATSVDCDANFVPDDEICQPGPQIIAFGGAVPMDQQSLWRNQNNVVRLTLTCPIQAPTQGQLLIQQMLPNGAYGSNLAVGTDFAFAVESGNVLRIGESGVRMADGNWYAFRNVGVGGWAEVAPFTIEYMDQVGDYDINGFVTAVDVALINSTPTGPVPDNSRADVNGDGSKTDADTILANASQGPPPPKPSGH